MTRLLAGALAALLFAGAAALSAGAGQAQQLKFFRIASGSVGGTYFPTAALLAQAISNPPGALPCERGGACGAPGMIAIAQSAQGSLANVVAVEKGQVESGLVQSDVAYWAWSASGVFADREPMTNLRAIASLYPEHLHAVATRKSGVTGFTDLKGKRIALGLPASGALVGARIVLGAAGLAEDADYEAAFLNSAEAVARLKDGSADAMLTVTGYPQPAIADLADATGIALLPVDGDLREAILADNLFFSAAAVPGGTYAGVPDDTPTVAVTALWLTHADQAEETVYQITRALWSKTARALFIGAHAGAAGIRLETALEGMSVPLHPGAERFYREAGLID
ncbi:MAG: TAXI family TRAP transporter solute-binding subunit, partial [Alphaproteobacteria bacterium]